MINRDEGVHHTFTEHSRSCNYRKNKVNIRRRNICPTYLLSLLEASWRFWQRACERTRENVCVWEMRNEKHTYSWELKSMKDTVLIKSSKKRDKIKGRKKGKKEKRKYWETRLDARACVKEREWTEEVWEWKRRNVTSDDREISYEHFFLHFASRRII